MLSKTTILASLALFGCKVLAADPPDTGALVTYSQAKFGGTADFVGVVKGTQVLCQVWEDIDNKNAALPVVKSYVASNIACFTFPSKDCSGDANGYFASSVTHSSVNMKFGSLFCSWESS